MQQKEGKIFSEIDSIINIIHKDAPQELRQYFHSWSKKVLSSVSGRPNNDSLSDLRQAITKKVANTHDQRSVLQVQETTQRFINNNMISRKPQVLRMLLKLSDEMGRPGQDFSQLFPYPRKKDLNLTTQTNFTSISQNLPQPRRPQQLGQQLKIIRNRGSIEQGISETDIVKQLSFIFTNTSSNQILQVGQSYQLKNSINVSQTVRKMVHEMSDLGWLHKKILKYSQKEGTVRKALRLGIQQQLNEFYRWIASMENFIKENRLNLRKLYVWAYYPEQILRWLAIILDAVEPFEGSNIISIINSYRPSGISAVDGLINRILTYTLQPLLNYIHNWTYLGELLDSRGQFFIAQNKKIFQSEQWNEKFKLINENIPNILNGQSAKMIFDTGKAIHFLKHRCNLTYYVKTPFFDAKNIQNITVQGSNTLISATFMGWLQTVHSEVNKVLVETLFGQFNLKYHLQSMKNFFLLGKGDFIQTLYDFLKDKLSQKKQQISEHSLDGYISDAILKCFPDFPLPDNTSFRSNVAERLLAKKIDFSNGGSIEGWDCFNFSYSLQRLQPLQTLFSPETMINYQKIFNFLWKIKQIEEILKNIWIIQSRESSLRLRRTKIKQLYSIFHFTYRLRSSMSHFLTNLQSYLMTTIETAWNRFWDQIGQAKSFNDIIRRHRQFQQQILQITLNTPKDKNIQVSLGHFFSAIYSFKTLFYRLQDNFDDYFQKLRLYEDRQRMAQRGIIAQSLEIPQFHLSKSYKELRENKICFDEAFNVFYIHLKKEGEAKNSSLNVLLAKLDFSAYYSTAFENNQF